MLRGGLVKQVYELAGEGAGIREIAERLGISRNTVRKYLRAGAVPKQQAPPPRSSKLDPHKPYLDQRLTDGVQNCALLLRELQERGYTGGITIVKDYVQPQRRARQPRATVRFETEPGEQAQIDFGHFRYHASDGRFHQRYAFVLVLAWSRALYLEFIRRADVSSFLRCHVNALRYFGGVPRRCLYDNTKVVVLGRDAAGLPVWNTEFLDFSLRLGFAPQLCRPYRAQTKGRVESGIKYVRGNFWPGARFTDDADLNRQALEWCETVANVRLHGTTHERPVDRLPLEHAALLPLPATAALNPFLRETRIVGRDGFVCFERASYGVPWQWAGQEVQVQAAATTIEIWRHDVRVAVHPRALHPGQRFTIPGQWEGLSSAEERPSREPVAVQLPSIDVQRRALVTYDAVTEAGRS